MSFRIPVWVSAALACLGDGGGAAAASFDSDTGKLTLDGVVSIGFEGETPLPSEVTSFESIGPIPFPGREIYGPAGELLTVDEQLVERELEPSRILRMPELALEGESVFELGGDLARVAIGLEPPLLGRRVEVRLWQRPEGTEAEPLVTWELGGELGFSLGDVRLYPTGRGTTDGWREWTTGPVDWGLQGATGRGTLVLRAAQDGRDFSTGMAPFYGDVRVLIDAIEVIDLGPASVPETDCTLITEAERCGPDGMCAYGHCVDAAAFAGRLPTGTFRSEYLQRRIFEVRHFAGARRAAPHLDEFAAALGGLDRDDVGAREFWTTMRTAYRDLIADGHSYAPELQFAGDVNAATCLHLGEPDLLPDVDSPAPMVFEAPDPIEFEGFWSTQLRPGDVLVSIDGLPPEDWAELASLYLPEPTDPRARFNAWAPHLVTAAILTGAELVFERCEPEEPRTPCTAQQVEQIRVDLAAESAGLLDPSGDLPFTVIPTGTVCDYRFGRAVEDPSARYADVMTYADDDGVRIVQANGTFAPVDQVEEAFGTPVERMVLDHRNGNGGVRQTEALIGSFLTAETDLDRYEVYPPVDLPFTDALREAFLACGARGGSCGGLELWDNTDRGGGRVNATARLAVLNGFDISSSDFLSMRLSLRRGAPTRIFGAVPTAGAFGGPVAMPPYGNERRSAWVGREDLQYVVDGEPTGFLTGTGVDPDEVVLQRQSDALIGVDTALEAALEWVRQ